MKKHSFSILLLISVCFMGVTIPKKAKADFLSGYMFGQSDAKRREAIQNYSEERRLKKQCDERIRKEYIQWQRNQEQLNNQKYAQLEKEIENKYKIKYLQLKKELEEEYGQQTVKNLSTTRKKEQTSENKLEDLLNAYENEQISGDEFALRFIVAKYDINTKINSNNQTLLHLFTSNSEIKGAKILIRAGADVNIKDTNDDAPIDLAINNNDKEMMKILLDAGATLQ